MLVIINTKNTAWKCFFDKKIAIMWAENLPSKSTDYQNIKITFTEGIYMHFCVYRKRSVPYKKGFMVRSHFMSQFTAVCKAWNTSRHIDKNHKGCGQKKWNRREGYGSEASPWQKAWFDHKKDTALSKRYLRHV